MDTEVQLRNRDRIGCQEPPFRLPPRDGERLGIGVESGDLDAWMKPPHQDRKGARAAADVENAVTRLNRRLND